MVDWFIITKGDEWWKRNRTVNEPKGFGTACTHRTVDVPIVPFGPIATVAIQSKIGPDIICHDDTVRCRYHLIQSLTFGRTMTYGLVPRVYRPKVGLLRNSPQ